MELRCYSCDVAASNRILQPKTQQVHVSSVKKFALIFYVFLIFAFRFFIGRCFTNETRLDRTVDVMLGQGNEADPKLETLVRGAES